MNRPNMLLAFLTLTKASNPSKKVCIRADRIKEFVEMDVGTVIPSAAGSAPDPDRPDYRVVIVTESADAILAKLEKAARAGCTVAWEGHPAEARE